MRFIARHRKKLNVMIIIICVIGFAYLAKRTMDIKDVDVDSKVYSGIAMGTAIKKTIYSENASQSDEIDKQIDDTLKQLEEQISVRLPESEVAAVNRNYAVDGTYELSENLLEYLEVELQIFKETNGAFSPCVYPITSLWGIENGNTELPDADMIAERVACSNAVNIELKDDGIVFHKEDMAIDLGAVGKGIACDEVKETLMEMNVQGAVVSIGGSILAYGDKGNGKDWHIGIQDPRGEQGDVFGVVDVAPNTIISTSGDYEKYFEADGKRYHHIFDPATGYPADNGLISVTIIGDNGLLTDALSTACFVMGLEDGMAYATEKGVEAIFVTKEKEVYITKGLKKKFRLQADSYSLKKKL